MAHQWCKMFNRQIKQLLLGGLYSNHPTVLAPFLK
jgi:hypothetical protein